MSARFQEAIRSREANTRGNLCEASRVKAQPPVKVPSHVPSLPALTKSEIASYFLVGLGLFLVLHLHLLAALLGGLAVYELVHIVAGRLTLLRKNGTGGGNWRKVLAVTILASLVVAALTLFVFAILAFFRSDQGNLSALLAKMADVLDGSRDRLPLWLSSQIPENADELKSASVAWLREHADELQTFGADLGRSFLHALIGMIIGAMVSLEEVRSSHHRAPLAEALTERAGRLGDSFRRIVFAQARISALNTFLTGLYLAVALPLFGIRIPFVKTLIAITFVAGLLPVVGNLISNTFIVIVSLSHSLGAAVGALGFLFVIHKLEYFVNARIVGTEIKARAWELLLAMLAMEAAFGISGVIAAPIYYAFLKAELAERKLI